MKCKISMETLSNDTTNTRSGSTRKYFRCTYSPECKSSISMELPTGMDVRTMKIICPLCTDFRLSAIEETLKRILGSASLPDDCDATVNDDAEIDTAIELTAKKPENNLGKLEDQTEKLSPPDKKLQKESIKPKNDAKTPNDLPPRQACEKHMKELCNVQDCPKHHLKTCPDWLAAKHGCKLHKTRRCALGHPNICPNSWHTLQCFDASCNMRHLARTIRDPNLSRGPKNPRGPSAPPNAPRNLGPGNGPAKPLNPGYPQVSSYRSYSGPPQNYSGPPQDLSDQVPLPSAEAGYQTHRMVNAASANKETAPPVYTQPPPPGPLLINANTPTQPQNVSNHFLWETAKSLQDTQVQMNALLTQIMKGRASTMQYPQANLMSLLNSSNPLF